MSPLAEAMLIVFMVAWCVGVAAWFYATRFFMPMWAAGFRRKDKHEGYGKKALTGYAVFVAAVLVGLAAGGIAEYLGGGW